MIEIIPAIDIIDGQCVRLSQGKYNKKTVYSSQPTLIAKAFENQGYKRLHLVDLDGAKSGKPENLDVLKDICSYTNLVVDYSGGIRTENQMETALNYGASFIGIGSLAIKEPETFKGLIKKFGAEKFIVASDVLNKQVYINGWLKETNIQIFDLISAWSELGINKFMCTDISRDGMLSGVNHDFYKSLKESFKNKYIIASGGVSSKKDIYDLEKNGIDAVIVGKAFYEDIIPVENLSLKQC
ncbi:MAG: 1-(5-phosphoribosyl)-5-[(5-phosphoribosylamino)methylideneamino]imidazole-4-carboxamide isomerase [Bacteroidetes bacterium GWF2_33_16]|nr:MAG: 1-(5-phosphoribosyl)-5-[(5-phosphoribosylamino)methylideneamino]imidazole-4-carboxamide isomerase [Bacteroidetes bacterium GWE2_32_14]OFY02974.1 MAG: 1-(5-phosphoribosyl)-5-[(5-phosphoribosylamino)methylideneamino]imidazole-4-carboxamide isomerase [Bacteroidetes bacterium GWF2_33_16]